jgi:hypothetical protein
MADCDLRAAPDAIFYYRRRKYMAKIRSLNEIADKWQTVTPQRQQQFADGVSAPLADWATNTRAAVQNYEQGVSKAVANKRFDSGVQKAGTQRWKDRSLSVGVQRWPQGVASAGPAFAAGFAPYRDVIEKTSLPPRFPRGDVRNFARVQAIGQALNAKKNA